LGTHNYDTKRTTTGWLVPFGKTTHHIGCISVATKASEGNSNGLRAVPHQRLHMMTSCTSNMFAAFITMPCDGNTERCGQFRTVFEVVRAIAFYADLWPRRTHLHQRNGYPHKPERWKEKRVFGGPVWKRKSCWRGAGRKAPRVHGLTTGIPPAAAGTKCWCRSAANHSQLDSCVPLFVPLRVSCEQSQSGPSHWHGIIAAKHSVGLRPQPM